MAESGAIAAVTTVTANNPELLGTIVLCGIMGLVGQGIRAAVGLKSAATLNASEAGQQTVFNAAYLFVSLMIGFITGVLAGLALNPGLAAMDPKTLLGILAAGYAGTDFIENIFTHVIPGLGGAPASPAPLAGGAGARMAVDTPVADDRTAQPRAPPRRPRRTASDSGSTRLRAMSWTSKTA
jgi:hypothetical protein